MNSILLLVLLSLAGSSLAARLPYIIGGSLVTYIEFYPWMGSLNTGLLEYVCGCSMISTTWAVTAASCAASPPYVVRFGSRKTVNEGTFKPVLEVVIHESYSTSGSYRFADVAVVRFSAFDLTDQIKPIPLGATEEAGNANCHILGWGKLKSSDPANPDFLHEAKVSVISNSYCDNDWGSINSGHVCTNKGDAGITCMGDTGGPLVCSKSGVFELVGITSWQGSACSTTLFPVYTRVSYYRQWILGKVTPATPALREQDIPE